MWGSAYEEDVLTEAATVVGSSSALEPVVELVVWDVFSAEVERKMYL